MDPYNLKDKIVPNIPEAEAEAMVAAAIAKETKLFTTVLEILCEGRGGAALNAVTEDYPEIAKMISDVKRTARREALENLLRTMYYSKKRTVLTPGTRFTEGYENALCDLRVEVMSLTDASPSADSGEANRG